MHAANLALLGAVRSGAQHAMDWDGVPAEVIEVLDAFKAARGRARRRAGIDGRAAFIPLLRGAVTRRRQGLNCQLGLSTRSL